MSQDVVWLFLGMPWVCLRFVIVVFPDHTHLLFLYILLFFRGKMGPLTFSFRGPAQNLGALGYWAPVSLFPWTQMGKKIECKIMMDFIFLKLYANVLGIHLNLFSETVPLNTHKICFCEETSRKKCTAGPTYIQI